MQYKVRIAIERDFKQIHKLNYEFPHFIDTPNRFEISVEEMIDEQEYFKIVVAENKDGEIVGFASTFVDWYSWIGKSLYLDDLYVIEEARARGRGVGSLLMERVLGLAKELGCKKVKWQVSKWNRNAIEFYKFKGASIDDVEINCDLIL